MLRYCCIKDQHTFKNLIPMSVTLDFENNLWAMADKLRGNIQPSDYKDIVLGLIFLKYISDSFEERFQELVDEGEGYEEDRDFYEEKCIFFVPKTARWSVIKEKARSPQIGQVIDNAMIEIEKENDSLKGVLPKNYANPSIDKVKLGELIDLFSFNLGSKEAKAQDVLGRVYEYFLGKFGSSEGEFYTPPSLVKLLVGMIQPFKGKVYDPCCGSGGMFVQSQKFVEEHQGKKDAIHVYGQEYNAKTWQLCKMNLAIRGIDADLGPRDGDTFGNDLHKTLRADFILANPPFNVSDYALNPEDPRWKYGVPPKGNANYAWIEHIISKLSINGVAGFVMANGSMSNTLKDEVSIRRNIVEAGLVDCIVAMPTNLFYNVTIPVCLWFLNKKKANRKNEILFIDARKFGYMETRVHRELTAEEIQKICDIYHSWQNNNCYEDIVGFCKSVFLSEVRENNYLLTPGLYVGVENQVESSESFADQMHKLSTDLFSLFKKSNSLELLIKKNLSEIGYNE